VKKIINFIIMLFLGFTLASCGYRFAGSYSSLPMDIRNVYVDSVENDTSEPSIQTNLRSYLINQLNMDSRIKVTNKDAADGYLYVKIINYDIEQSSYAKSGFASSYRCIITVSVSFKSKKQDKYIIKDNILTSYKDYNANDQLSAIEIARNRTSDEVLRDLANKIKDDMFVNF